jgi:regulator of protease activity HflC (stomatin/prohibitin superfamily)
VKWDAKAAAQGDQDALEAVKDAERIFDENRAKGATAFIVEKNQPAKKIDSFDDTAEQIVMVPRVVGG